MDKRDLPLINSLQQGKYSTFQNYNRLFWTAVLPRDSVHANPGAGRAALHVSNLDMDDYHDVANALKDGPETDGSVSIDLE